MSLSRTSNLAARGVWITRAEPGAAASAHRVVELGMVPLIAPLLRFRPLEVEVTPLEGEALAFTSANGVSAMAALNAERRMRVFAVGDTTAVAARAAGYIDVRSARGDVAALSMLIRQSSPPGGVLHPAATETAGDLVGALRSMGVTARTVAVYETRVPRALPGAVAAALEEQRLVAALFHSPKAARAAAGLLDRKGREIEAVTAVALSSACAAPLDGIGFKAILTAAEPNEAALMARLGEGLAGGGA